jgi:hypothetical protein
LASTRQHKKEKEMERGKELGNGKP